jgi:hypothetical protein
MVTIIESVTCFIVTIIASVVRHWNLLHFELQPQPFADQKPLSLVSSISGNTYDISSLTYPKAFIPVPNMNSSSPFFCVLEVPSIVDRIRFLKEPNKLDLEIAKVMLVRSP